jgi:RNA polymerase sigma-70 factor (ECF subfamily)
MVDTAGFRTGRAAVSRLRPWGQERETDANDAASDDDALVAAALADRRAFDALYGRYVGPVYRYCHVRLGTREAAEDATSAIFLKALTGLVGYRPGNFPGWLYRIAANTVTDHQRHQRHQRRSQPLDPLVDPPDPAPRPDDEALARLESAALRAALMTLPDEQRAAVELQLAGWSGEQIAAALDRSPEAVRMLRYRALARLRAILDPDRDPESPTGGRR